MLRITSILLVFSILLVVAAQVSAQQSETPPTLRPAEKPIAPSTAATENSEPEYDENDVVRVSTSLITVPAEVMDRNGRFIANLKKEDFRIFEGGVEQELSYFAAVEQPFTVALLLDVSGSTQAHLDAIRQAANAFIKRLRPQDRLMLVSFDGQINVLTEAVTIKELRQKRLQLNAVNDGTVLYDTVDTVLNNKLATVVGRKAIVLLTDGVDMGSKRGSFKRNLRDAEESNTVIYTVQYNTLPELPQRLAHITDAKTRSRVQDKLTKGYAVGSTYLRTLAEKTGGRLYNADNLGEVPAAFNAITDELGRQYSLGYYPKRPAEVGETRDIKVRMRMPNMIVRARESYVATASR
ncbi:MAG TPA: VWA domain-containing protein [Pyrinomonadaceae bacterium]|nr:VWA domain-containing protein [Pyrinomonadaceae bacterium]